MGNWIALTEWAQKHGIGGARARRLAETGRIDAQLVCGRWIIDVDHPDPGPTPRGRPLTRSTDLEDRLDKAMED